MAGSDQDYLGLARPADMGSHFNAIAFLIKAMTGQLWTATLVKVVAVTGGGGAVALAGTVDVQPLVNQLDGQDQATPHGTIFGVPYFRAQGGANAIILDPLVGDLGIAVFADHDISSVVANKGAANPGSRRRFSPSDALYLGGFLNAVPTQYLAFAGGIDVESPGVAFSGNVTVGSGWSGSFPTGTGQIVTVVAGIITDVT
jgi:hypothetical protein